MTDQARQELAAAIRTAAEWLQVREVKAAPKRDAGEPSRAVKEKFDKALQKLLNQHFQQQADIVKRYLEAGGRLPLPDDLFNSAFVQADVTRLLIDAVQHGIFDVTSQTGFTIDNTLTNKRAAEWAARYAGELIKDVDKTSLEMVRSAVSLFADKPGFTLADVMNQLPYDVARSERIAVTEITRAYAEANQIAGEELRDEFGDVPVVKVWFTNNDDRVCDICGQLDGQEISIDENFVYETKDGKKIEVANPPGHVSCRCWTTTTTKIN